MELKNDKDFEEFIKQKAEELPVPDSLKPENMVKRIQNEKDNYQESEKEKKNRQESETKKKNRQESEMQTKNRQESEKETGKKSDHFVRTWMYRICAGAAVFFCGALLTFGGMYGVRKMQENQKGLKNTGLTGRESLCMELLEQSNQMNTEFSTQKEWYQWAKKNGEDPEQIYVYEKYDCINKPEMMTDEATGAATSTESFNSGTGLDLSELKQGDENREVDYKDTNVQVEGIDEADIIKTDGEYLYILGRGKVYIVEVKEELEKVSEISLDEKDEYYQIEMYVKEQKMVILENKRQFYCYDSSCTTEDAIENKAQIKVLLYDISNKEKPKLEKEIDQDGYYMSSRVKGDYLYLFTEYTTYIPGNIMDYDYYVPKIGKEELCYEDVCIFPEGDSSDSLLVSAIDLKKQEVADKIMLTSGSWEFYVSDENIYSVVYSYRDGKNYSEIMKIAYDQEDLSFVGKTEVEGNVSDQYFMDEKDGFLRLVAHVYDGNEEEFSRLYVLDSKLKEVGRMDNIAPGENLYSCRFMGNMAYFVTFRQVDPLFAADLSDPYNPRMVGQLKIPGFSEYLHPYGEDLLLGIGYDVDEETNRKKGVKLTMFDTSDPANLKEITSIYLPECFCFDEEPKAILADAKKNLIGISIIRYDGDSYYYCFSYKDGEFAKNTEQELTYGVSTRGIYIGDVLYVADYYEVTAISLDDFSEIESLSL